jgi:hypothetical protein
MIHSDFAGRICAHYIVIAAVVLIGGSACQSSKVSEIGIQPKYAAINPSRILAVTPVVVSVPGIVSSIIDPALLHTLPMTDWVEAEVLKAFRDQPAVNGVSFQAVRRGLEQSQSPALTQLRGALESTIGALQRPSPANQSLVQPECFSRRDFVGFYSLCLRSNFGWKKGLNELSAAVLNADAALFVFVTELRVQQVGGQDFARMGVEALLVDTNNADLIWSGSRLVDHSAAVAKLDPGAKSQAQWKSVNEALFDGGLWDGFPGRKPLEPSLPPGGAPFQQPSAGPSGS